MFSLWQPPAAVTCISYRIMFSLTFEIINDILSKSDSVLFFCSTIISRAFKKLKLSIPKEFLNICLGNQSVKSKAGQLLYS